MKKHFNSYTVGLIFLLSALVVLSIRMTQEPNIVSTMLVTFRQSFAQLSWYKPELNKPVGMHGPLYTPHNATQHWVDDNINKSKKNE